MVNQTQDEVSSHVRQVCTDERNDEAYNAVFINLTYTYNMKIKFLLSLDNIHFPPQYPIFETIIQVLYVVFTLCFKTC
jgi:hypothetical protein